MNAADFEKVWYFTFSVERLKGMAASIARSMAQHGAQPAAQEHAPFDRQLHDPGLRADYLRLLDAIGTLQREHARYLAGGLQGSIAPHLASTEQVLNACADIIEKIGYPGAVADAQSLKGTARKCLALRAGS